MPDISKKTYVAVTFMNAKNAFEGKFNFYADCKNERGAMYLSDKPVPTEGLPINKNTANLQYAMWDRACGSHGQYVKFSN
jgi:hypothetical protein